MLTFELSRKGDPSKFYRFLVFNRVALVMTALSIHFGCNGPQYVSQIDSKLRSQTYQGLSINHPEPARAYVLLSKAGKPITGSDNKILKHDVELYLRASHLFSNVELVDLKENANVIFDINITRPGSPLVKFIKEVIPLPFTWNYNYEVDSTYIPPKGSPISIKYLFTFKVHAVPNQDGSDLTPAFGRTRMIESIVQNFLHDLQPTLQN